MTIHRRLTESPYSCGALVAVAVSLAGSLQAPSSDRPSTSGVSLINLILLLCMIIFPKSGERHILNYKHRVALIIAALL